MTSGRKFPKTRVAAASIAPGAPTGTAYSRKSGMCRSRSVSPPLACGLAPIRRSPRGERRMGANPQANGGLTLRDLHMPDFREYAVPVGAPGAIDAAATRVLGNFLPDVIRLNQRPRNFRLFGPADDT